VEIERVSLQITGVEAQALLKARLDNIRAILDRALTTVDRNPDLLRELIHTVDDTVGELGDTAEGALGPGGAVSETTQRAAEAGERALGPGGAVSETADQAAQTGQQAVGQLGERVAQAGEELEEDFEEEEDYEEEPQAEADEDLEEEYEEGPEAEADEDLPAEAEQEQRDEPPKRGRSPASASDRSGGSSTVRRPNRRHSGSRQSLSRPPRPPRAGGRAD
jgi:hypothetical protein